MSEKLVNQLRKAMINCQTNEVLGLVQKAINQHIEATKIVNEGLTAGIRVLGDRFERGEAYLPELAVAAEAMKEALAILEPYLTNIDRQDALGIVVIGTVQGDIHDIGKSIVATMLTVSGFAVHDMGVDVSPTAFVEKAQEVNADIIAMSALLTTTMDRMQETVELLQKKDLLGRIKVIVGGAPVTERFAKSIGAHGYGVDFNQAVKEAKRLTRQTSKS